MIFSKEKLTKITIALKLNKIQFKKINHFTSFFGVTALLPAVYMPIMIANANIQSTDPINIKLDTSKSEVVVSADTVLNIVPGESQINKMNREKAEAEAKAIAEAKAKKSAKVVTAKTIKVYNDPSDFDVIYARASEIYGVDASILKAIHTVETGRSGSTNRSNASSGAQGPMQFIPSTWRAHGVDGNGDGIKDVNNVEDSIFAAAAYLRACGYPNVQKALWGYNPSMNYYNKVLRIATGFGFGS